jgi:hypothetical protein
VGAVGSVTLQWHPSNYEWDIAVPRANFTGASGFTGTVIVRSKRSHNNTVIGTISVPFTNGVMGGGFTNPVQIGITGQKSSTLGDTYNITSTYEIQGNGAGEIALEPFAVVTGTQDATGLGPVYKNADINVPVSGPPKTIKFTGTITNTTTKTSTWHITGIPGRVHLGSVTAGAGTTINVIDDLVAADIPFTWEFWVKDPDGGDVWPYGYHQNVYKTGTVTSAAANIVISISGTINDPKKDDTDPTNDPPPTTNETPPTPTIEETTTKTEAATTPGSTTTTTQKELIGPPAPSGAVGPPVKGPPSVVTTMGGGATTTPNMTKQDFYEATKQGFKDAAKEAQLATSADTKAAGGTPTGTGGTGGGTGTGGGGNGSGGTGGGSTPATAGTFTEYAEDSGQEGKETTTTADVTEISGAVGEITTKFTNLKTAADSAFTRARTISLPTVSGSSLSGLQIKGVKGASSYIDLSAYATTISWIRQLQVFIVTVILWRMSIKMIAGIWGVAETRLNE